MTFGKLDHSGARVVLMNPWKETFVNIVHVIPQRISDSTEI